MKKITNLILFLSITSNICSSYLFQAHPKLKRPIVELGHFPSPIYNLPTIAKQYNLKNFYVKDDGVKCVKYDAIKAELPSGNKIRKLEFLLAHAKENGYKTVCTVGSAGSNHALATAMCAKQIGLDTILILDDQPVTSAAVRNLKLMTLFAKEIKYTKKNVDSEARSLSGTNGYYFIPMGGSDPLGILGFVNAMFELKDQINQGILEEPDYIYVTLGTGGTSAGLIVGAEAAGIKSKIISVRINSEPKKKTEDLLSLINRTRSSIQEIDPCFPCTYKTEDSLTIENSFAGGNNKYAVCTQEAADAIKYFYQETKKSIGFPIKLESTYTGKTLSALFDHANKGLLQNKNVLFWNTFSNGTFEDLTAEFDSDYERFKKIPENMIHYLTDDLQSLDQGI
ncbi:MAG: 1-aminocyclopropane-1-carboxylate deaminase [candidate division TM6 bacterium GW2011_GWF2_32_72]|nr:MAG: 1-aminocyclopropane-1-carboxylate deaminase [candidate division TM6 bacterium GW2011_GWF2_32_72]